MSRKPVIHAEEKDVEKEVTTTVQVNRELLYETVIKYNNSKVEEDIIRPYSQRDIVHLALKKLLREVENSLTTSKKLKVTH